MPTTSTESEGGERPGQEEVRHQEEVQVQAVAGLTPAETTLLAELATLRGKFRIALGSSAARLDDLQDVSFHFRALERIVLAAPYRRARRLVVLQGHAP